MQKQTRFSTVLYVMVVFGLLLVLTGFQYQSYADEKKYVKLSDKMVTVQSNGIPRQMQAGKKIEEKIEEKPAYQSEITVSYDELKAKNPDYLGWLYIPGTGISYPVVQCLDNTTYLKLSFDKTASTAGAIFADGYGRRKEEQQNLILYGHNMRNGSMFGTLKKYKDANHLKDHGVIEFHVKDKVYVYDIVAVRITAADMNSLNFKLSNFDSMEYVNAARAESIPQLKSWNKNFKDEDLKAFEVKKDSNILTLCTCVGIDSQRLLVSAVRR